MNTFDVCVTLTSGLLAIGYPILVEVISRLDEKYFSTIITTLFNREREKGLFTYSIYASLLFVALYLCELKPIRYLPDNSWIINNSAILLLAIINISLVVCFFFLINKIFIYYRPQSLVQYLIKRHNALKIVDKNDYNNSLFIGLSDLVLYSIKIQNEKIAKQLSSFSYSVFKTIRDESEQSVVIYPTSYYSLTYRAIEELGVLKTKKLAFLETIHAGSILLLGELQNSKISKETFSQMWQNQRLALSYDRVDFVMMHWQTAHQHYDLNLKITQEEYSDSPETENKVLTTSRKKERQDFLTFHYALAALLLFQKKYETIKNIFDFTQSEPPNYALLPNGLGEIFSRYFRIINMFDEDSRFLSSRYPFPGFTGIQSNSRIVNQICSYLALLFLRQYSIIEYFVYQKPLELPFLPSSQGDKKFWLEHLPFFRRLVEEHLKNRDMLTIIQLDFITDDYCKTNRMPTPLELLDEFEKKLEESIEHTEVVQEISPKKKEKFLKSTRDIMTAAFQVYDDLRINNVYNGQSSSNFINGSMDIFSKSAFAEFQGFDHLNYDTIAATSLVGKFQRGISESFFRHKTEQYLFKPSDLIPALRALNILDKQVAIVSFARDVEYPVKRKLSYKNSNYALLGDCIFILKEDDLPTIHYLDTKDEHKEAYQLEPLDTQYNLYASVIDLNVHSNLHQELGSSGFRGDLRKQVLVSIYFNTELKWKMNVKCVAIQITSPYREDGILSSLNDVQEF